MKKFIFFLVVTFTFLDRFSVLLLIFITFWSLVMPLKVLGNIKKWPPFENSYVIWLHQLRTSTETYFPDKVLTL